LIDLGDSLPTSIAHSAGKREEKCSYLSRATGCRKTDDQAMPAEKEVNIIVNGNHR